MIIRKVDSSARMLLSGQTFNAMAEVVNAYQAQQINTARGASRPGARSSGLVRVKNASAGTLNRFAIQIVTGTLFSPANTDQLSAYLNDPILILGAPTAGAGNRLAILQEPIPAGGIGLACISGFTVAYVNVIATTDTSADVTAGHSDYLTSGLSGPFTILSPLTATGQQWVAGKLGGGSGAGTSSHPYILPVGNGVTLDTHTWSVSGGPYYNPSAPTVACDGVTWTPARFATGAASTDPVLVITRVPIHDSAGNLVAVGAETSSQIGGTDCQVT